MKDNLKVKRANISIVNMAEVDLPVVVEKAYSDWVLYGEDNLYPLQLIEAWQQSAVHNALVNGISQLIAGEGVSAEGVGMAEFDEWAGGINKDGLELHELVGRTAFDLYLYGYFAWELIWNVARTKIVGVYHLPAESVRSGKANDDGVIENYYYSADWTKFRNDKFKPKKIKAFDKTDRSEGKQLLFVKQYRPNQFYYSTPDYIGAMNWILMDNRISEFHLNNLENGFFPSALIQFFNGEPEQREKDVIESKFQRKFIGKGSKKLVFVYNETRDEAVQFDTFEPARLDQRFKELSPQLLQNILISHRVTSPMLFGIKESTGLGNNAEEIKNASLLFNKMVIMPYQQIIAREISSILRINLIDVDITIETLQPIQFTEGSADADTEVEMSDQRKVITDKMKPLVIKSLSELGKKSEEFEKDYWLVMVGDKLTDKGRELANEYKFAIASEPEDPSSLDLGLYKVRYQYNGVKDDKNRDFCDAVLSLDLIYRYEDINQMTMQGDNPEFGSYDIFTYKGSYNCRHRWERMVWFRKRDSQGRFLPSDGLLNDEYIGDDKPPFFPLNDDEATSVNEKVQK